MGSSAAPTLSELYDLFWRSFWTFVAAALGIPTANALFDVGIPVLKQMELAGATAVIGIVLVFARQKLGTLPPPTQVIITPPGDEPPTPQQARFFSGRRR